MGALVDRPDAQGVASAESKFLFLELVLQLQEEFIMTGILNFHVLQSSAFSISSVMK